MCIPTLPRRSKSLSALPPKSPKTAVSPKQTKPSLKTSTIDEEESKTKKFVSFREIVMVRPVLHVSDYTQEERSACWFEREDKKRIKAEIKKALQRVKDGIIDEYTRGLERFSDGGKTKHRRVASIRDVLVEQENQIEQAIENEAEYIEYDFSKIRQAYKLHSRTARHLAHAVGRIDAMEASCQRISEDLEVVDQITTPTTEIKLSHTTIIG